MPARSYRLGRRASAVGQTRKAILTAARDLLASGEANALSAGAVARRAGVSRVTVYNQFGSRAGLLRELAAGARGQQRGPVETSADPVDSLRQRIVDTCSMWASDPGLFRGLPAPATAELGIAGDDRALVERLAAAGRLRPGCSLKEAEDVIAAITSFAVFDRLHKDGRRSTAAVVEVLVRLGGAIVVSS